MSQFSTVWVLSDVLSPLPELMGGASSLGQSMSLPLMMSKASLPLN